MKFLCDVHISYKIVKFLSDSGFHSVHVNRILQGSHTKDSVICNYANKNNYILITKDQDFKNSFHLNKTPNKLIKINLGNTSNQELIEIFKNNLEWIRIVNVNSRFIIEIDWYNVTFRVSD